MLKIDFKTLHSPLAQRLIFTVITVSASIAILLTVIQLYGEYRFGKNTILHLLDQIEQVHVPTLSQSVWATNYKELQLQIDGIDKLPNVRFVSAQDKTRTLSKSGTRPTKNSIERQYALVYQFAGKAVQLGTLTVVVTLDELYSHLFTQGLIILGTNTFKTTLVALFLFVFFNNLITRHLLDLSAFLQRLTPGKDDRPFVLDRPHLTKPDELDNLATAFNHMLQDLKENTDKLTLAHQSTKTQADYTQAIINHINDGLVTIDQDGLIASFNPAACHIFGYTQEEVLGRNVSILMPRPHRENHDAYIHNYQKSGKAHILGINREVEGQRKTGEIFPMELEVIEMKHLNNTTYMGTIRDISERKKLTQTLAEKEETFRRLFEETSDAHYLLKDLKIVDCNNAAVKLFGFTDRTSLINASQAIISPPLQPDGSDSIDKFLAMSSLALQEGHHQYEWVAKRADGTLLDIEVVLTPIHIAGEQLIYVNSRDITQRKQIANQINQLNAELEQRVKDRTMQLESTNKELEAFSYSVSHDLRSPLRGIDGFSLALIEDYSEQLDDTAKDYINRIRKGTQNMGNLIDDLLRLSRISRAELHTKDVDLSSMASTILADLHAITPGREVSTTITPNITAIGDPGLIQAAMENLLGNAWKYSSKTPQAHIEFGRTDQNGDTVYFVRDNGVGFNMAHAEKLFGAFQRLHHRNDFEGSGIGLATVKRIIERSRGRVWFNSEPGKGATFYFTLPANTALKQ